MIFKNVVYASNINTIFMLGFRPNLVVSLVAINRTIKPSTRYCGKNDKWICKITRSDPTGSASLAALFGNGHKGIYRQV